MLASCSALLVSAACASADPVPMLDLPPRPSGAPGGAEIARELRALDLDTREERIFAEIARGNVPSWLRRLERVEITGELDGRHSFVTFWATPDYLAVGSDTDFLLVPLSPRTAQRIASLTGASLPTPRMVDAVWASARVRLPPIRIPPDEFIRTVHYFERHDRLVRAQRWLRRAPPGVFVAGHKLDLVVTTTRSQQPGPALYGWHRPDGQPVQPLYTGVRNRWISYHLGIRLVDRGILVDGTRMDLLDALVDPELAPLLGGEARSAETSTLAGAAEGDAARRAEPAAAKSSSRPL